MSTKIRFLLTAIALLSTGCAAPMTEVVVTRQSGTIDQHLFKEGDKVWVTYQDKEDTVTRKGFVLGRDHDSVKLDVGRKLPADIEYRLVQTIRRPGKDRWYVGVSAGTFQALEGQAQEFPYPHRLTGSGISLKYAPYSNGDIEGNVSIGGKIEGYPSWVSISGTGHFYLIIPRTYFLLGVGYASAKMRGEDIDSFGRLRYNPRKSLAIFRMGFGAAIPVSERFNLRAEADILGAGLLVYLESKIR